MSMLEKPRYYKEYSDLCHDFALDPFYQGERLTYKVRFRDGDSGRRMTTDKENVYSYNTHIACATMGLEDTPVILITDARHSHTSARQLWILRNATSHYLQITVPRTLLQYRDPILRRSTFDSYVNSMTMRVKNNYLRLKAKREEFCSYYERIQAYAKHVDPEVAELLSPFKETYDNLKEGNLKEIRERAKKERQEARHRIKDLIKGKSVSELGEIAFERKPHYDVEYKKVIEPLRKHLTKNGKNSFVWFNYETQRMHSSQYSSIPLEVAVTTMKRYLSGKIEVDDTVEHYRVVKVTPDSLRVNCHEVTRENIEACIAEYNSRHITK